MNNAAKHRFWTCALMAVAATANIAHAQSDQAARMRAALAAPERAAENKARDAARKPIEVVQFLGLETGMTALDVIAAGGWFTEVLSAAVGPTGKVYAHNPAFFTQREGFIEREQALHRRLGNVEALHGDVAGIDGQVDVAVTALNVHDVYNNGGEAGALPLLQSIHAALKPGGVLGFIDHVGVAGQDNRALHRLEKPVARNLLEKAGFVVEAESDILANPADDHTKGVNDASLERRSDQMLLRARKPR